MKVLRAINNNLVLALDEAGCEVILTGRGLGFQARPGQEVDAAQVVRVFVPSDRRDPGHLAQMLGDVPPQDVQLISSALSDIGREDLAANPSLVVALADHVRMALQRAADGTEMEYPLLAEVKNLYADEYRQATALRDAITARSVLALPDTEAVPLALHLVGSGLGSGDLTFTYTMTGLIRQMIAVIEQTYELRLDPGGVSIGRFVTHLRYLFVRIREHKQLDQTHSAIGRSIREAYPDAVACATRLAELVAVRLGAPLTDDEIAYLALHVARVTSDRD